MEHIPVYVIITVSSFLIVCLQVSRDALATLFRMFINQESGFYQITPQACTLKQDLGSARLLRGFQGFVSL